VGGTLLSSNSNTTNPTDTSIGQFYYYVVIANALSGNTCTATSNTSGVVTIYRAPIISPQTLNSNQYCIQALGTKGNALNITVNYSIGSGVVRWFRNSSAQVSGSSPIDSFTNSFAPPIDVTGRNYYFASATNINAPAACNSAITNFANIEVFSSPTVTNPAATNQIYCQNQISGVNNLSISATNGGYGTITYQWYVNKANNNINGTRIITNGTSNIYTPPVNIADTNYYYVVVKNGGPATCDSIKSVQSGAIRVLLNPNIISSNLNNSANYCQRDVTTAFTITANNGVSGQTIGLVYQWYGSRVSGQQGNIINGANTASFNPFNDSLGNFYYTIVVSNGSCSVSSQSAVVTVYKAPTIQTQIGTTAYNYCLNDPVVTPLTIAAVDAEGGNSISYAWYRNNLNQTTGGTIQSSTSASINPTDTNNGRSFYYAVVTNNLSGNSCRVTSATSGAISVYTAPILTNQSLNGAKYCVAALNTSSGSPFSIASQNGIGIVNVIWYRTNISSRSNGIVVGSGTSYDPLIDTVFRFYYYAVLTNNQAPIACNNTTSNLSGAVEVYGAPNISAQPAPTVQNLCQNQSAGVNDITVVGTAGGYGTLSYQWYFNTLKSISGATAITVNGTNANISPIVSSTGLQYYYVRLMNDGPAGCNTLNSNFTDSVNVFAAPTITTVNLNAAKYCVSST
ncbi:MAG: hypothetical protein ORN85_05045, partial [Sediminibacterium sp.]|nr:hypothetical protein [Sediminibacterium sp.]